MIAWALEKYQKQKDYLVNVINLVKVYDLEGGDKMKRLIIVLVSLFVFSISAQAQMGGQQGQKGQGMMMKDMMQMMMEMVNMQEKMMMGTKAAEKKQMMRDMAQMKEKMQKMMSMGMMGMDDSQSKLKCAEQWLKKAIDLHELHMKDPKTTTDASQMELMDQIKKAYGCITGTGSEMSSAPSKAPESKEPGKAAPSKADPHKH